MTTISIIPPTPIPQTNPLPTPNHRTFPPLALVTVNYLVNTLVPGVNDSANNINNNAQFVKERADEVAAMAEDVQAKAQAMAEAGVGKPWVSGAAYVGGSPTQVPDTVYINQAGKRGVTYRCAQSHSGRTGLPSDLSEAAYWEPMAYLTTVLREQHVALGAGAAIDLNAGAVFSKTITGNTTFTVSNLPSGGALASGALELTNAGAFALTFWANSKWVDDVVPEFPATGVSVIGFYILPSGVTRLSWQGWYSA